MLLNFELFNISLNETLSLSKFGNSIPIELEPGITEILADSELVFLAISSDKFTILETLTPAAGSNSFNVTTGPELIFLIFPSTPKSKSIFSRKSSFMSLLKLFFLFFIFGCSNNSSFGKLNILFYDYLFFSFFYQKKKCFLNIISFNKTFIFIF